MGLVGILWVLYGYSVAFGNDVGAGLLGNPFEAWGLKGLFVGRYTGDADLPTRCRDDPGARVRRASRRCSRSSPSP